MIIRIFLLGSTLLLLYTAFSQRNQLHRVSSTIDSRTYKVRESSTEAADRLATIRQKLLRVVSALPQGDIKERLTARLPHTVFSENPIELPDKRYTSYSINKGEEIVMCLRSSGVFFQQEILLYVALHEMAHVACPEEGHTALFYEIFAEILRTALQTGIITNSDFTSRPVDYCGITISEKII